MKCARRGKAGLFSDALKTLRGQAGLRDHMRCLRENIPNMNFVIKPGDTRFVPHFLSCELSGIPTS